MGALGRARKRRRTRTSPRFVIPLPSLLPATPTPFIFGATFRACRRPAQGTEGAAIDKWEVESRRHSMHTSPAGGKIEFTARIRYSWKTFRAFRSPRMTGGASIELRESAARYSWNSSEIEPGPRITFPSKAAPPCYKSGIVYLSIASRYVQQV